MAYTTKEDILSYYNGLEYKDSEGDDNNISETEAVKFIDEQTIIIDLTIGKKYALPIVDVSDLTYLKLVCDKLVVCQIDKILRAYAADDESEFVRRRNYCKEAKEMIDNIMNGDIPLNSNQKSFSGLKYNKTTIYSGDGRCREIEENCV